ncbi:hypothetical protein [Cellulomonas sp. URHD0024]|uniref:hypothetical protein n=1 Tax=Cellulomonas sp. URHD0024 TaxID=1302620 RepID=UPI000426E31B|nr:hypothetical protein [Cellulomonas sp. URHD0024]
MTVPAPRSPAPQPNGTDQVFRQALRDMLVLLGVLTVVGVLVGYLVDGMEGVWGALIGVLVALIFSGTTVVSVWRTSRSAPTTMLAVLMGAWLGKIVVVIVVLASIRHLDFYNARVLAIVLMVGVIGSAILDARAVQRGRITYFDEEPAETGVQDPSNGPVPGPDQATS